MFCCDLIDAIQQLLDTVRRDAERDVQVSHLSLRLLRDALVLIDQVLDRVDVLQDVDGSPTMCGAIEEFVMQSIQSLVKGGQAFIVGECTIHDPKHTPMYR